MGYGRMGIISSENLLARWSISKNEPVKMHVIWSEKQYSFPTNQVGRYLPTYYTKWLCMSILYNILHTCDVLGQAASCLQAFMVRYWLMSAPPTISLAGMSTKGSSIFPINLLGRKVCHTKILQWYLSIVTMEPTQLISALD